MKVPKMYKSSDRYNAGTDVIYDDDSKLQYAPFIYAGVTAKDNGDGGGDDEEGEDTMVITLDAAGTADVSFKEIKDAFEAGKIIVLKFVSEMEGTYIGGFYYLVGVTNTGDAPIYYRAYLASVVQSTEDDTVTNKIDMIELEAATETDNMNEHVVG